MKDEEKRRVSFESVLPKAERNVLARLEQERAAARSGRFRVLDRTQRGFATPHAGIAPLAMTATSGGELSFTSLDHLGLTTHPRLIASVAELLRTEVDTTEPAVISAFRLAHRTEALLAQLLGFPHVVLQRSGARTLALLLAELVGVGDHVLVDGAADRRVVEAVASTASGVTRFGSTDPEGLLTTLENVRKTHPEAGILVVTQSLFPVDGETPDLGLLRALGEHFEATLLVDATHDFGCVGPRGTGFLGLQDVLGYVDLVTADLGRTFGCEAGFVATRSGALEHRLARAGSTPLPTVRAAELLASLELSGSDIGDSLRKRIDDTASTLRRQLAARGFHVFGQAGPIVPVLIGDSDVAAVVQQYLEGEGIIVDLAMPRDPPKSARLVFRVTALHREAHVFTAVDALETACAVVRATPTA